MRAREHHSTWSPLACSTARRKEEHLLTLWTAPPAKVHPVVDDWKNHRSRTASPRPAHRAHWAHMSSVPPHFLSDAMTSSAVSCFGPFSQYPSTLDERAEAEHSGPLRQGSIWAFVTCELRSPAAQGPQPRTPALECHLRPWAARVSGCSTKAKVDADGFSACGCNLRLLLRSPELSLRAAAHRT